MSTDIGDLRYILDLPPSGPVTLTLVAGLESLRLLSVPQYELTQRDQGCWRTRARQELRSQIIDLECALAALDGESLVPVVVRDRRPVHTCAEAA